MPTLTTNYALSKPLVNNPVDQDQFGPEINGNFDTIDSALDLRIHDMNCNNKTFTSPILKDVAETAFAIGNISGAVTVDYTNGGVQSATLIGNVTSLTVSNWPPTSNNGSLTLELFQDATGGRTIVLTSAYKTPSAAGITLSTAPTSFDELILRTHDAGTTIKTNLLKDYR